MTDRRHDPLGPAKGVALALALAGCTDDGPFGPGAPDPSATRAEPEFTPRLPNAAVDADGKRFDPDRGWGEEKKGPRR